MQEGPRNVTVTWEDEVVPGSKLIAREILAGRKGTIQK